MRDRTSSSGGGEGEVGYGCLHSTTLVNLNRVWYFLWREISKSEPEGSLVVSSPTPVVLLGFNRPDLTHIVFQAIRAAKPKRLFLVMDGPRNGVPGEEQIVQETRRVVSAVDWTCEVTHIYSETNLGLKRRISSGLDEVFSQVDSAIILEDDCVPHPTFFDFAGEMLQRYLADSQVGIVSGSSRLRGHRASPYSYDFSADIRIWGWATWARTWNLFRESGDLEASWSPSQRESIIAAIPQGPRRTSMKKMLERSLNLDSWALPFVVHCQKQGYLNIVPEVNLVENIGFGARSTHTKFEDFVSQVPTTAMIFPLRHPSSVNLNIRLDALESRLDAKEWWLYPLLHPIDVTLRALRFLRLRLTEK